MYMQSRNKTKALGNASVYTPLHALVFMAYATYLLKLKKVGKILHSTVKYCTPHCPLSRYFCNISSFRLAETMYLRIDTVLTL